MPRRSWRDLIPNEAPASPAARPATTQPVPHHAGDLESAAALVPSSRLATLMEERRALEDRLRNLTGLPGQSGGADAHRNALFQVPSFAERQAELLRWEDQRRARMNRPTQDIRQDTGRWARGAGSASDGLSLQDPASGLGATGLRDHMRARRSGMRERSRGLRDSVLGGSREIAQRLDGIGRPLRDLGEQLAAQNSDLDELDRRLAREGVSDAERREVRDAVSADEIDKVARVLGRANKAIDAPRRAVAAIERFWQQREEQISGPMDRFSGYAADRERRLSTETGGSGNLFERMQANRNSALRRRREARLQERRDERRRQQASERATRRRSEDP